MGQLQEQVGPRMAHDASHMPEVQLPYDVGMDAKSGRYAQWPSPVAEKEFKAWGQEGAMCAMCDTERSWLSLYHRAVM